LHCTVETETVCSKSGLLHLQAAPLDSKPVQPAASDESQNCDINRAAATASGGQHQNCFIGLTAKPQSILKEAAQPEEGPATKPVLTTNPSSTDSKSFVLVRNKSLKRVSFDENPELIGEEVPGFPNGEVVDIHEEVETETDLPALEEVTDNTSVTTSTRLPVPAPTFATTTASTDMAGQEDQVEIVEGEEPLAPPKPRKPHIKGITFREFDHVKDFEDLVRTIVQLCSGEEQERLREMEDWIVKAEGTWVLAEGFNTFLGNVLHRAEWPSEARVAMLRLLSFGAEQDDIVLILHMDRKDHLLMNYAQQFDRLPIGEQENLALLFCNLFETGSASEWLLYISEWEAPGGGLPLSNIRVTTKVAVNALLGDTPTLVNYGSALMANLGDKEVFDDVCSELAMAILQFFQGKPPEEQVWRCMKALGKFCSIGSREVPQLVKMIGPEPTKFAGLSARVDELVEPLAARLAAVPMF